MTFSDSLRARFKMPVLASLFCVASIASFSPSLEACPASVKNLRTNYLPEGYSSLCQFADHYSDLKKQIGNANRIADLRAPRFINLPDWMAALPKTGFNPFVVYGPATWTAWDATATAVDNEAEQIYQTGGSPVISLNWLLDRNRSATVDRLPDGSTAGSLRTEVSYGLQIRRAGAARVDEISLLTSMISPAGPDRQPLLTWTGSHCVEDLPEDSQGWFDRDMRYFNAALLRPTTNTFRDPQGITRQCGWLTYPSTARVQNLLNSYTQFFQMLQPALRSGQADIIFSASQLQRTLVGIHPFSVGNGRTSRLVMDLLLESYGLPAPIFVNQSIDLSTPDAQWAAEISRGMLSVVQKLEACVRAPNAPRCQRI